MDFTGITKKIWNIYLDGTEEEYKSIKDLVVPDCVIIGTGKHEFYQSFLAFTEENPAYGKKKNGEDLKIRDYWCEQTQIAEDMYLVYGELSFFRGEAQAAEDERLESFMESRFSVIYKLLDGDWRIIHIHQSVPNVGQAAGEYYPKTLIEQMEKEKEKVKEKVNVLEELANKDGLTGLYNYRAFCERFAAEDQSGAWLMVADIDDFKLINDMHGHLQGNRVLKRLAHSLSEVCKKALICRMGGDEFLLLFRSQSSEEEICGLMEEMLRAAEVDCRGDGLEVHFSVGAARVAQGENIDHVLQRADDALYKVKKNGKNGYAVN